MQYIFFFKKNRLIICVLLSFNQFFNQSYSADLIDVYKIAEKNDAIIQQARAVYSATQEEKGITRANLLPQLNLTATKAHVKINRIIPVTQFDYNYYDLRLDQSIFDWEKWSNYLRSEPLITAAEKTLYTANQDLIIRVSQSYFNILAAQDTVEFNEKQYEATNQLLNEANARLELGELTIADVEQVKANLDSINADLIRSRNEVENNRDTLQMITNIKIPEIAKINPENKLPELNLKTLQEWLDLSKKYSLDIQVAQANRLVASRDINVAQAGFLPTANLTAEFKSGNDRNVNQVVGISTSARPYVRRFSLNIEIDSPNLNPYGSIAKTNKARALYHKADQKYIETYQATASYVTQYYNTVVSLRERIKAMKQSIIASQKALDSTRANFEVGERTYVIVLDSIKNLYDAKRNHKIALYQYLIALLQLEQSTGILDIKDLGVTNSMLAQNSKTKINKASLINKEEAQPETLMLPIPL